MIKQYKGGMANGFFVTGEKGVIAIDTGCEEGEDLFLKHCEECGVDAKDIILIVLTHGHSDHFYNIKAFKKLTGAPIVCHAEDVHFLHNGETPDVGVSGRSKLGKMVLEEQEKSGNKPVTTSPVVHVDISFSGEEYDLNEWGIKGKIIHTPGHTKGSTAILLDDGSVFVGDTFCQFNDETGGAPAFLKYEGSTYEEVLDQLDRLVDMGANVFYSGHGGPYSKEYVMKKVDEERHGIEAGEELVRQHLMNK